MKKLMSIMLGLALVTGAASLTLAQDKGKEGTEQGKGGKGGKRGDGKGGKAGKNKKKKGDETKKEN